MGHAEPQADWPRTPVKLRVWHERRPQVREFIHGAPKLMAPGSSAHTLTESNAGNALDQSSCHVLVEGATVELPDIVVTGASLDCSTPRVEPNLSPSNQKDDIGRQLSLYLKIPSLRHHLVIHQDRRQIVHHPRRADLGGVFLTNIASLDLLHLDPPGIEIALVAICEGVPLH